MKPVSVEKVSLKDGIYRGFMSGYTVEIPDYKTSFKTTTGVRGHDILVEIDIKDGIASIKFLR